MKKFFSFLILAALFLPIAISGESAKNKILRERMEKEQAEVTFAMKITLSELETAEKLSSDTLLKYKKLLLLEKSSRIMKDKCLSFDYDCRKFYNVSLAYLGDELKKTKKELESYEKIVADSMERKKILSEKLEMLEKGVETEIASVRVRPVIPELKNFYSCTKKSGWNTSRGIFVPLSQASSLPFPATIKDVVPMRNDGYLVMAETKGYTINFAYAKSINVRKDEKTESGRKLFSNTAGDPVFPDKLLIFITKNNQFVNPVFMCK